MSVAGLKALVRRYVDQPWDKGNSDVWDELRAPEFTVRNLTENSVQSRFDLKRDVRQLRTNPDYKKFVEQIILDENRAGLRWTMSRMDVRKI